MIYRRLAFLWYFFRLDAVVIDNPKKSTDPLVVKYGQLRKSYVERFGWLTVKGDLDVDRYDDLAETKIILAYNDLTLMSGLRVTRIPFNDSLSLHMFDSASASNIVENATDLRGGVVIDVTRLVNKYLAGEGHKAQSRAATFKVLVELCVLCGGFREPLLFTVEDRFIRLLRKNKVRFTVLHAEVNKNLITVPPKCLVADLKSSSFVTRLLLRRAKV